MSQGSVMWRALGTSAQVLVTERAALPAARRAVERVLVDVDLACSRFRADSEITRVHALAGTSTRISPLLTDALAVALDAARWTNGLVDPTVGAALQAAGYDRDFAAMHPDGPVPVPVPVSGWQTVHLDRERCTVEIEPGTRLDLGSTGKAYAADLAAAAAAEAIGPHGVLVSLGGDLAIRGPAPAGGWPVGIADGHEETDVQATVAVLEGGLATSSTTQRRWQRQGRDLHHIVDPRTGTPAEVVWRTVTVAAPSCVRANTASTVSIVLGADAPSWLTSQGLPARLVGAEGEVVGSGGWAVDRAAA